jgi:hypothetical protein
VLGVATLFLEFVIALTLAALVYRDRWVKAWRILFLLPMLVHADLPFHFCGNSCSTTGRVISDLITRVGFDLWQYRFHGFDISCPPCSGGDRRLAMDAIPVHHFVAAPAGHGQGSGRSRAA